MQLVESPVIKGGIRAIVVASQSSQELPSFVDVPVGRDLLLTAIGGNGEDGMNGEDGGNGHDGVNGVDASEVSDATVRINTAQTTLLFSFPPFFLFPFSLSLSFHKLIRRKAGSNGGHGGKCVVSSIFMISNYSLTT